MRVTYDDANLKAHGITREDVDDVADSPTTIECGLTSSERGNERIMLVGNTSAGRLLEVGIEFFHFEERIHVFHADDATKQYEQEYQTRMRP